jgi:hypothetical protein
MVVVRSPISVLIGLCVCTAGCASAAAEEPQPQPRVTASTSALLRDDAAREALRAKLRASLSRSPSGMAAELRPSGVKLMRQNGGFQHATLVVRNADGTLGQRCTDDPSAAESALLGDAP